MSIKSTGLIELTCNKCNKTHILNASDLDWQCEEKSNEKKGMEIGCESFFLKRCECGNKIIIRFKAVERPKSEFDPLDYSYSKDGGKIVLKEFKLYSL
jgi:hypothetical protein